MEMTVMNGFSLKKALNPQVLALGLTCSFMTTFALADVSFSNKNDSHALNNTISINTELINKSSADTYLKRAESILKGVNRERDFKKAFENYYLAMKSRADEIGTTLDYDNPINKLIRQQSFIMSYEEAKEYRENIKSWFNQACNEYNDTSSCQLLAMMKYEDSFFEKGIDNAPSVSDRSSPDLSDGSHLRGLPMTRDFILDSYDNFQSFDYAFAQAGLKGSKKIFSIKPTGDTKPRAVILLNKKVFRRTKRSWFPKLDLTIKRKNITLCEGFMTLPRATVGDTAESVAIRKNEVITFMPVLGVNANNTPEAPEHCQQLLENNYDYNSAQEELDFILKGFNKGRSPYLAVYESDKSPYSSMILSLGKLSPESIKILSKDWSELIIKVYENGDSIEPTVAMATMLSYDPKLQQAQQDSNWKNISIAIRAVTCGGAIAAGSVVSLGTFMSTPMCRDAIEEAAYAMGYTVPSFVNLI